MPGGRRLEWLEQVGLLLTDLRPGLQVPQSLLHGATSSARRPGLCRGQPGDQGVQQTELSSGGGRLEHLDQVDSLHQNLRPRRAEKDPDLHGAPGSSRGPRVRRGEVPDQQLSAQEMSGGD